MLHAAAECNVPNELARHSALNGRTQRATGTVVSVHRSQKLHISEVKFEYSVNGRRYRVSSYSKEPTYCGGDVPVEYAVEHPACSRIPGMSTISSNGMLSYLGCGFGLAALLLSIAVPQRARMMRLLRTGALTAGRIVDVETRTRRGTRWYKYAFEFEAADGFGYTAEARESEWYREALEDERREPLVYDSSNPRRAFMLDNIPGRPRTDEKAS